MILFLDSRFYSTGIYVCPYAGNTVLITIDMEEVLILGSVILQTFIFFSTVLAILASTFPHEFQDNIFHFEEKAISILVGFALNLLDCFGWH